MTLRVITIVMVGAAFLTDLVGVVISGLETTPATMWIGVVAGSAVVLLGLALLLVSAWPPSGAASRCARRSRPRRR